MRRAFLLGMALLLAGCGSVPPVPDFSYFRLPDAAPATPFAGARAAGPVLVAGFSAEGVHAEQAVLHALDPGARELRAYHYQMWVESPTQLLRRRLIAHLRSAGFDPVLAEASPGGRASLRIAGSIRGFERVPLAAGGFKASVRLALSARAAGGTLLVDREFAAEAPAAGPDFMATIDAFGVAVDMVFDEFQAALAAALGERRG